MASAEVQPRNETSPTINAHQFTSHSPSEKHDNEPPPRITSPIFNGHDRPLSAGDGATIKEVDHHSDHQQEADSVMNKTTLSDDDSAASSNGGVPSNAMPQNTVVIDGIATTLSPPLSNSDDQTVAQNNNSNAPGSQQIGRSPSPEAHSVSTESSRPSVDDEDDGNDEELRDMMMKDDDTDQHDEFEEDRVELLAQSQDATGNQQLRDDEELLLGGEEESKQTAGDATALIMMEHLPSPPPALLLNEPEVPALQTTSSLPVEMTPHSSTSNPPPIPARGHRRTPSMPVNTIVLEPPQDFSTPPVVPRRHKKTTSLVQVEARLEYNPQAFIEAELAKARSKTAEPGVDLSKAPDVAPPPLISNNPIPPVRTKSQPSSPDVERTLPLADSSSNNKEEPTAEKISVPIEAAVVEAKDEKDSPRNVEDVKIDTGSSTPADPVVLVTQEQLVAELKDVLRRKNRYIEVVPEGARFQKPPPGEPENDYEVPCSSSSLSSSRTASPRPPNPSRSTPDPPQQLALETTPEPNIVITEQPASAISPRRLVEIVLVGDAEAAKIAFAGASPDNKTLSFNVKIDGAEVALLIHNQLSTVVHPPLDSSAPAATADNSGGVITDDEPSSSSVPPQLNEAYKKADVVVGCFARNNAQSLENLRKKWLPEVRKVKPDIPVVLAAERLLASMPTSHHDAVVESPSDGGDSTTSSSGDDSSMSNAAAANGRQSGAIMMTVAECETAAREMGAATFIEYAAAAKNVSEKQQQQQDEATTSTADDNQHEIRQVFEAAVRAYTVYETEKRQKENPQSSQDANKQPKKRCCTIL